MAFDAESKVETFPEFPDDAIEKYLAQWSIGLDYKYRGISRSDLRDGNVKKPNRSGRSSRQSDIGEARDDSLDSSGVIQQLPERRPRSNSGHSSMSQGHTLKRANQERTPFNLLLPNMLVS
jgi:hypothetical protein